jgi:hypothetical protein
MSADYQWMLEHNIQLVDQISSSRTLRVGDVSFNTSCNETGARKPSKSWFYGLCADSVWCVHRICKLCTFVSDRIDEQFKVLIFKQCHWNVELTQAHSTCTFLSIVDMPFGNATSNWTHRGLFSVVICRRINLVSWELYVYLFIKCCLYQ